MQEDDTSPKPTFFTRLWPVCKPQPIYLFEADSYFQYEVFIICIYFFLFRIEIESPKFSSNRRLIFALTFISVFVTFVSYCYILQTNMVHILYTFIVIFALTFINVFAKIPTYCYFVFQVDNMVYILHALILIFAHFHLLFSYTCISNEWWY